MIKSIFTVHNPWILTNNDLLGLGLDWKESAVLGFSLLVLFAVGVAQEKNVDLKETVFRSYLPIRWAIYLGAILFIVVFGTYGYGFNAQSFIYGGF